MVEISAKGVRGFFLYSPVQQRHFFRIYDSIDKTKFTDYSVMAEEIEVELLSDFNALIQNKNGNWLDFSSSVLGINNG